MTTPTPSAHATLLTRHLASPAQSGMWYLSSLEGGVDSLHGMAIAYRLCGDLDVDALQSALDALVVRHAALRTRFVEVDGVPWVEVQEPFRFPLACADLRTASDEERLKWREGEARRGFDLDAEPLVRGALAREANHTWSLVLVFHHAVADGVSLETLFDELRDAYAGRAPGRARMARSFSEYVTLQAAYLASDEGREGLDHWKSLLADLPEECSLAPRSRAAASTDAAAGVLRTSLGSALAGAVEAFAADLGVTPFVVCQAAFAVLVSRLGGLRDVPIGTPVAGRIDPDFESTVGLFANTVVLRNRVDPDVSFASFVESTQEVVLDALSHAEIPFDAVVRAVGVRPRPDVHPLFQLLFIWRVGASRGFALEGLEVEPLPLPVARTPFELVVNVSPEAGDFHVEWEFDGALFEASEVASIARTYAHVLARAVGRPEGALREIPLCDAQDRATVMSRGKGPTRTDTLRPFVHETIATLAQVHPSREAVACPRASLTYGELDRASDALAAELVRRGVRPSEPVAVALDRSCAMVVALLGVMKSGGAYVPLDLSYPEERLAYVCSDAKPRFVVTRPDLEAKLPPWDMTRISIDAAMAAKGAGAAPVEPFRGPDLSPEDLVYCLYTSGSTGRPKGVMLPHGALAERMRTMSAHFLQGMASVVPVGTSFSFDVSFFETFAALTVGGRVRVLGAEEILDMDAFAAAMRDVTCLSGVPSLLRQFREHVAGAGGLLRFPALERIMVGSDKVSGALFDALLATFPGTQVSILYGPTEASVYCASHDSGGIPSDADRYFVGTPFANTFLCVVDACGALVPPGFSGELLIGGPGLARGYLGRPELTDERFVEAGPDIGFEGKLYRTGDWARLRPEGVFEFLGRMDHQVKVRGFRIEIGEIEAALRDVTGVAEAVVVAREHAPDDVRLAAFAMAAADADGGFERDLEDRMKDAAKKRLPAYMVPHAIRVLQRFPLNANGKIDRAALLALAPLQREDAESVSFSTDVERRLAAIWSELLDSPPVSPSSDFFSSGGHSLLATRLAARVRREWDVPFTVRHVFDHATLGAMARDIASRCVSTSQSEEHRHASLTASRDVAGECVHQTIFRRAQETPSAPAVTCALGTLDYAGLAARAFATAQRLLDGGLEEGEPVIVAVDRTRDTIAAMLGILEAGGVVVPVDAAQPGARLARMISRVGARRVILTSRGGTSSAFDGLAHERVVEPRETSTVEGCLGLSARGDAVSAASRRRDAYVIFTSGSTGEPKGVAVGHSAFARRMHYLTREFLSGRRTDITALASLHFDIALFECFGPLCVGGHLRLSSARECLDFEVLARHAQSATTLVLPPGMNMPLADFARARAARGEPVLTRLETIIAGGERVPVAAFAALVDAFPRARVNVLYGPTEAVIVCMGLSSAPADARPDESFIGCPFPDTTARVIDDTGEAVPPGVPGELVVGGAALARCYFGDEERTTERFVRGADGISYRTGDLVMQRQDGTFAFLGRIDRQVKVRGHRVELGEIEAALLAIPEVADAAAVAVEHAPGDVRIHAFVEPRAGCDLRESRIRAALSARLAEPMRPSAVAVLEALPRTVARKIDHEVLKSRAFACGPASSCETSPAQGRAPAKDDFGSDAERRVAAIWERILKKEVPSCDSDFFALGGHSLLAGRVVASVGAEFGIKVPLRTLFLNPTLRRFAASVQGDGR